MGGIVLNSPMVCVSTAPPVAHTALVGTRLQSQVCEKKKQQPKPTKKSEFLSWEEFNQETFATYDDPGAGGAGDDDEEQAKTKRGHGR